MLGIVGHYGNMYLSLLGFSDVVLIILQVLAGFVLYIVGSFVLKLDSFLYFLGILSPFMFNVFSKIKK